MNEYTIIWICTGAGIGLVLASMLYALGGRKYKAIRRFGASAVLTATVALSALGMGRFTWWLLLIYPFLTAGFCLGYGGDTLPEKIQRRVVYYTAVVFSGVIVCFIMQGNSWWVLPVHLFLGMGSVYLGVKNPIHAAAEEFFICMLLNLGLLMYVFIV